MRLASQACQESLRQQHQPHKNVYNLVALQKVLEDAMLKLVDI